ncbi:uncharacterized protein B0H64DRAFT_242228 [Chaetomium fimeti]|uniref:Aminoglycoside phosphotransferase domain-containing protein n=1 Tax=Chaetomium fimeti TaxID=1854472 RepID=A0AAE0H8E4_9PEZI|nr:hypothetical protein B0H64DRAFT_242228 [Chaetomium fimeti]
MATPIQVQGISHLEFLFTHGFPENSPANKAWRKNLVQDMARLFARTWKAPQAVGQAARERMAKRFEKELRALLSALPERFHAVICGVLAALPRILTLPMVLLHNDLSGFNIMVEEEECRLVGVIDWAAAAEIGPFGMNLHSAQDLMSKVHLEDGRIRYEDYDDLERSFWETLSDEVGGLSDGTIKAIKAARVLGLLRSCGFTSQLANMPDRMPIRDDDGGRSNIMILDGLLVNPATRFEELNEWLDKEWRGKGPG